MAVFYSKNKKNSMYFINFNGIKISDQICSYLKMTFEDYINTIKTCGGKYSPKYGWFLPNEDSAVKCCVMLNLWKK